MLLVLLAATLAVSRAMYPTEAQREAIAEMKQRPDYAGENAFALLWTLDRDVPDDELQAVMAEDVRRISEQPSMSKLGESETWEFASAAEKYPDLSPSREDTSQFCTSSREQDCLARVRENLDAYVALIDRNQKLLDRVDKLHAHDYVLFEFPYQLTSPLPKYQSASLVRTRHAVQFAQGETWNAVAATCRDIATWRRLGAHSYSLITQLIGVSNSTIHNGRMLADMLAELPVDMRLPEPCGEALAPPSLVDVSICNAMRNEFHVVADATEDLSKSIDQGNLMEQLSGTLLFDDQATLGMRAEAFRSFCEPSERERLRTDRRDLPDVFPRSLWRLACVGNTIGCIMNSIGASHYADYRHRLQDHGARLRVLGTLAWMRRHADDVRSPSELLTARPEELKSPERDIEFGPEGSTLRVPLYHTARSEYWSIPLPPALHLAPPPNSG